MESYYANFNQNLQKCWVGLKNQGNDLASTANRVFLAFGPVYLCEVPLSAMVTIKTKYEIN